MQRRLGEWRRSPATYIVLWVQLLTASLPGSPEVNAQFPGRRLGDPSRSTMHKSAPPTAEGFGSDAPETSKAPVQALQERPSLQPSSKLQRRHARVATPVPDMGTSMSDAEIETLGSGEGSRSPLRQAPSGPTGLARSKSQRPRSASVHMTHSRSHRSVRSATAGAMNPPLPRRTKSYNYGGGGMPTHAVDPTGSSAQGVPDWQRSGPVGDVRSVLVSPYRRMMPRVSPAAASRGHGGAGATRGSTTHTRMMPVTRGVLPRPRSAVR